MAKVKSVTHATSGAQSVTRYVFIAGVMLWVHNIAYGQSFDQLSTTMSNILTLLQGAGVAVVTVAIAWAGYKMVFQHARWADVATVVLGALLLVLRPPLPNGLFQRCRDVGTLRTGIAGSAILRDPIVRGCARPAMTLGVPLVALVIGGVCCLRWVLGWPQSERLIRLVLGGLSKWAPCHDAALYW